MYKGKKDMKKNRNSLRTIESPSTSPLTMAPTPSTYSALLSTSNGLGIHFTSPHKARNPKKTRTYMNIPGRKTKCQRLLAHLDNLLHKWPTDAPAHSTKSPSLPDNANLPKSPVHDDAPLDFNFPDDVELPVSDTTQWTVPTATRSVSNQW